MAKRILKQPAAPSTGLHAELLLQVQFVGLTTGIDVLRFTIHPAF